MPKQKTVRVRSGGNNKHSGRERDVLTREAALFHPWFLPRPAWRTIIEVVPREYLMKMRDYFDRYGCISCKRRDRIYGANGMCKPCFAEVGRRLRRCLKRRFGGKRELAGDAAIPELLNSESMARKLLRDLVPAERAMVRSNQRKYNPKNPTSSIARLARPR